MLIDRNELKGQTKLGGLSDNSSPLYITKLKYMLNFLKKNQPISIAETITFFRLSNLQQKFWSNKTKKLSSIWVLGIWVLTNLEKSNHIC